MLYAVGLRFDRDRHLLLNLLGSAARPLGDDLNVGVGHIRIRFDRQGSERIGTPNQQQQAEPRHHEALFQCKIDELTNHVELPSAAAAAESCNAPLTTESPACRPFKIS